MMRIQNQIERLRIDLHDSLPGCHATIERPKEYGGRWWLDATFEDRHVVIVWLPKSGQMGVTRVDDGKHGYGESADWVSTNYYKVLARVLHLLAVARV